MALIELCWRINIARSHYCLSNAHFRPKHIPSISIGIDSFSKAYIIYFFPTYGRRLTAKIPISVFLENIYAPINPYLKLKSCAKLNCKNCAPTREEQIHTAKSKSNKTNKQTIEQNITTTITIKRKPSELL